MSTTDRIPTPYVADGTPPRETADQLRARIPGWGVDLDPADRPSVPKLRYDPGATGAHWDVPDRQPDPGQRERSLEHEMLTPAFGTTFPLRGPSGAIRRYAYERFSEGRAAHWLLLLAGDRVDAAGAHLRSFLTLRPDNPITQTGIRAEVTYDGIASRRGRVDARHHVLDPVIVAGPWIAAAVGVVAIRRRLRR